MRNDNTESKSRPAAQLYKPAYRYSPLISPPEPPAGLISLGPAPASGCASTTTLRPTKSSMNSHRQSISRRVRDRVPGGHVYFPSQIARPSSRYPIVLRSTTQKQFRRPLLRLMSISTNILDKPDVPLTIFRSKTKPSSRLLARLSDSTNSDSPKTSATCHISPLSARLR